MSLMRSIAITNRLLGTSMNESRAVNLRFLGHEPGTLGSSISTHRPDGYNHDH